MPDHACPPESQSLHQALRSRWERDPQRVSLRTPDGETWTYEALGDAAARMAAVLRSHGAEPGARVMVQVDKSPYAVALYLAVLQTGAVYTPLNPAYTDPEVAYFVADARPRVFVGRPGAAVGEGPALLTLDWVGGGSLGEAAGSIAPDREASPGGGADVVAMLYTSGTTGRPKGAMLTSDNLVTNARALHRIWAWEDDDVLLHVLPIFHTHGLFVALHCALLGASQVILCPRFAAGTVRRLLPEATVMMGVPTMYHRLLADPDFGREQVDSMRLFTSGSAPLPASAHRAFADRTGHLILERYGMTETGMITSNPYHGERVAGTVGYPLPEVEMRVMGDDDRPTPVGETGIVQVRGPNLFAGYWQLSDKTAESFTADGFFRTGDLGQVAADGRLTLVGRASDLIVSGGLNVYPKEVEAVLDECAGVAESAVVGVPHPDLGEAVLAVVVGDADETALLAACSRRLARYKQPRAVVSADRLPRNAMGKVDKQALRERHGGLFAV